MSAEQLERIVNLFDEINNGTPWQPSEPKWWLEMMELRRMCWDELTKLKSQKS